MKEILNIYKPLGMTTVRALERFKKNNPEYEDVPLAYTGRLDPMAEGVLVVLAGKERYEAKKYQKLDKEYIAKILFGFSTDSFDLLGIVEKEKAPAVEEKNIKEILKEYKGEVELPLPPYSSYKIEGKPMFHLERKGELNKKDIPVRKMIIHKAELNDFYEVSSSELYEYLLDTIGKVKGDFRQEEIISNWSETLKKTKYKSFPLAEVLFEVSGGTYIRTVANDMGKKMKTGALLYHLKRNKVGDFTGEKSMKI